MEEWEILPHRHREHIEEWMEEWMEDFTTEALRALRNTEKREGKNGRVEFRKTERQATAWRNIDSTKLIVVVLKVQSTVISRQATAWRNVCRISGQERISRCSATEQEMELLMFLDQVEIKFAVTNFVQLQIQWCCTRSASWWAA